MQTQRQFADSLSPQAGTVSWAVERCQNPAYERLVLVELTNQGEIQQVCPLAAHDLDSTASIPAEIQDDFRVAGLCLGAGCFKASLVMSRRIHQCEGEYGQLLQSNTAVHQFLPQRIASRSP